MSHFLGSYASCIFFKLHYSFLTEAKRNDTSCDSA